MAWITLFSWLLSAETFAAPGEYWEVTTKMEMAGMPFSMPATTTKVCIGKGHETDPRQAAPNKDCEMTDIKISGKKTSWKVRCNHDGDVMNGSGENSGTADGYEGTMHLTGNSHGRNMDMTQTYSGKRVGGNCDTEEQVNKIKGEICDTSKFDTLAWIGRAEFFLNNKTCPGKKEPLCNAVRKDAPRDADVYQNLVTMEKNNGGLITKACKLNMEATTKALCKTINDNNYGTLSVYCPAEAKTYQEEARKKACEGRSYTAHEDLSKCLNGQDGSDNANRSAPEEMRAKSASDNPNSSSSNSGIGNPAQSVIEGAKKLKGLFGF